MPISKSAIEKALLRMQKLSEAPPQQAKSSDDLRFIEMLQTVLTQVSSKPHLKGDKGENGDNGRTPIKYRDYFTKAEVDEMYEEVIRIATPRILSMATPKKNVDYFDGEKGDQGEQGDAGNVGEAATMDEMDGVSEGKMSHHEAVFNHKLLHDKNALGELEIDSSAVDGKFLKIEGKKIMGVDLPAPKKQAQPWFASQGVSNVRSYTVTASQILDAMGIYVVDATAGNITITLPSAAGRENNWFELIRIDSTSNTVTIVPTGSETMSGMTDYVMQQWSDVKLFAYQSNYLIRQAS